MPCNSDYMEPTRHERESRRMAKLIIFVYAHLGKDVPSDIKEGAANCYGCNKTQLDRLCALLCEGCKELDDDIIYNGRDSTARALANWWDEHQEADRVREEVERKQALKSKTAQEGLSKLTPAERKALGL